MLLLGFLQHFLQLFGPAVELGPLLCDLLLTVPAKGHLPEDDFGQVQGADSRDVPLVHLIAQDLRPWRHVVGIALRVRLEVGQPVQLLIGESVRTGEVADLGIAVEIGEQLVLLEEGCGEGLLIVYQVPNAQDDVVGLDGFDAGQFLDEG